MNKNVPYEPTPVYSRRILRNMLRESAIRTNGYHKVNPTMSKAFKKLKGVEE